MLQDSDRKVQPKLVHPLRSRSRWRAARRGYFLVLRPIQQIHKPAAGVLAGATGLEPATTVGPPSPGSRRRSASQRAKSRVRSALVGWIYVLSYVNGGGGMRLSFWFCFWSAAVGDNSQFGVFNSLLSRREFPACAARELAREGLICLTVFAARREVCGENRRNSRFDGKNWEFFPTGADPSDCVHRSIGDCRSSAIVNDAGLSPAVC
jgi:hypothetical protein